MSSTVVPGIMRWILVNVEVDERNDWHQMVGRLEDEGA